MIEIRPTPLTKELFASFGEVIEIEGAEGSSINQGFAERFNDLAHVDILDGSVNVSVVIAQPRRMPIAIELMERHPLGSQIFFPLQNWPWLVLVCTEPRDVTSFRAFTASGLQGVNYARNIWHHPLLVLDSDSRFLVVDRKGPGDNLEEVAVARTLVLEF